MVEGSRRQSIGLTKASGLPNPKQVRLTYKGLSMDEEGIMYLKRWTQYGESDDVEVTGINVEDFEHQPEGVSE